MLSSGNSRDKRYLTLLFKSDIKLESYHTFIFVYGS